MLIPAGKIVVFDVVAGNLDDLLGARGFEIAACRTPGETLESVVCFRPETLVLNVGPAPGDAFEATRLVKSMPAAALLPVLHVAPAGSETAIRSLECADAWVPESIDPAVLAASVAALVRRFRAHARVAGGDCELYRTIARHLPNAAVYAIDRDLTCILAEGPALERIGCSREMLEGKAVSELSQTSGLSGMLSRALSGEAFEIEKPYQGRVFLAQFVPLRNERQEITAAMVVATDISERKRLEAQFHEAQRMESIAVLAGGVAHDFNNLLTTVLGNASLIAETLPEGCPDLARVQQIVLSAEYAADLTRQLLAYAGKARLVAADMDISDAVRDIARLARSFVPSDVELELDLGSGIPAVRADRNQIHQVLMNLLLNASESCGHRGAIRVRTGARVVGQVEAERAPMRASPGRYAVLEVRDSGSGIDPAMLPRIFDPFFTTKFSGRGLGLAAVQGIVRSHRGFIEVESAPGAGSCFRVMLPALPETAE